MIRLPSFPPLVWVVLVGTLLTRMALLHGVAVSRDHPPELSGESNAAEDAPRGSVEPRLEISMDPARLDLDLVHSHLNTTYWAKGRARDVVERSLRHSLCFGAYAEGSRWASRGSLPIARCSRI